MPLLTLCQILILATILVVRTGFALAGEPTESCESQVSGSLDVTPSVKFNSEDIRVYGETINIAVGYGYFPATILAGLVDDYDQGKLNAQELIKMFFQIESQVQLLKYRSGAKDITIYRALFASLIEQIARVPTAISRNKVQQEIIFLNLFSHWGMREALVDLMALARIHPDVLEKRVQMLDVMLDGLAEGIPTMPEALEHRLVDRLNTNDMQAFGIERGRGILPQEGDLEFKYLDIQRLGDVQTFVPFAEKANALIQKSTLVYAVSGFDIKQKRRYFMLSVDYDLATYRYTRIVEVSRPATLSMYFENYADTHTTLLYQLNQTSDYEYPPAYAVLKTANTENESVELQLFNSKFEQLAPYTVPLPYSGSDGMKQVYQGKLKSIDGTYHEFKLTRNRATQSFELDWSFKYWRFGLPLFNTYAYKLTR